MSELQSEDLSQLGYKLAEEGVKFLAVYWTQLPESHPMAPLAYRVEAIPMMGKLADQKKRAKNGARKGEVVLAVFELKRVS